MKTTPPRILAAGIATVLAALVSSTPSAHAVNGAWSNLAGGSWATATNWTGSVIATGTDGIADFSTLNITANATVTLDGARTIGTLKFGDATTASNDWTLNTGTGGPLTMDVTAGQATIQVTTGRTATIAAVLAGVDGINVTTANTGAVGGNLVLSAANTFTGGLTITGGTVQLNNATAAGTNVITIASSANTAVANKLVVNGGVTIANNVVINANATGTTGRGVIEQVGTGQSTVNGAIVINGSTFAGGHFLGSNTVGNELVLGGAITSSVQVAQRAGRVIYRGGGTGYTSLAVTDTALVGATNGLATTATVAVGVSGNGTLDLNGFDQSLAGLILGNAGSVNTGTVALGTRTLTLTGPLSTITGASFNAAHAITGTGTLALGASNTNFTVADGTAPLDLTISTAISGTAGFNKLGTGTLVLNGNVTNTGTLAVTSGTLAGNTAISGALTIASGTTLMPGTSTSTGTIGAASVTFGAGSTTLHMNVGAGGDLVSAGALVTNGLTTINAFQLGGALANGTYNLLTYTGATPGLGGFSLTPVGHVVGGLIDTGTAIALQVTGNDRVIWDGTNTSEWSTAIIGNWKRLSSLAATDYVESDDVIFQNAPTSEFVNLPTAVNPSKVTFTNTSATTYTLTGSGGINGTGSLTKTANGTVVLITQNGYVGATTVSAGTLELDHDATGNQVLTGTSGVDVAGAAALRLTRDDGGFTFSRNLTGAGTVEVNAHTAAASAVAQSVLLTGNSSGFTGTVRLLSPSTGTWRIQSATPAQIGSGSIDVQTGAQFFTAAATYANSINIAGTGFAESAGNIGALRLESGATWAGPITVNGTARIGAHNGTATVSGGIGGGDLEVNATNFNNGYTLIFTGSNNYGTTTIGGQNTQVAGVPSMRLNIGAGGTSGTLGTGNVVINGDGANGVLGFDRSDSYTLLPGQTITGAVGAGTIANSITRTFIDFDTRGAGFSDNGNTITLGSAAPTSGGFVRLGQARPDTVTNLSGTLTAEKIQLGGVAAGINAVLNISPTANISANFFSIGEAASATGGVVNQAGGNVTILGQLRAGHFATETGTYNISGGLLTLSGASPNLTPSTAAGGGANATGDNNINGGATATIHGGGIYLGIDGTGVLNQTGGTVTTNWIVLDNRTDTVAGANMDGIDRYSLSGAGSVLAIRSTYGLIQRSTSSVVSFGGGTVRVDNTGTGTGTGVNLTIPLDAIIDTVAATTTNLDTNGAGNTFTLPRDVRGGGTLNLTGSGTIVLNGTNFQRITAGITGSAAISKLGTATTTLAGSGAGYTGAVSISAGQLTLPDNASPVSINVADFAVLGGEASTGTLTLGSASRTDIFFNPNTAGALTAGSLVDNTGNNNLNFTEAPTGAGPWTALNYTSRTGSGGFFLAGAAGYRVAPVVTDTGSAITVNVTGTKALTWTGAGGGVWDQNSTVSWKDITPAPDTFFTGDTTTFDDTTAVTAVSIASGVSPWKTTVNATTNAYTFTSSGAGLSGIGNLEKTGTSTLTLIGINSYSGKTVIGGGTVAVSAASALGLGTVGNTIELSGGGRLNYTGTAALDLGINRHLAVGSGGGVLSHSGTAAVAVSVPGNLSGSGALAFRTTGTSGTVSTATSYALTGTNAGFTGGIVVEATGNILSTLNVANANAVPNASSITLNHPAASVTTGNATTLNLAAVTLPAATTLNMTAFLNGAISQRSQVTSTGSSAIGGPIVVTANAGGVVQFAPPSGTLTLNGNITESSPGAFGTAGNLGVLFLRAAGNTVVNGTINLPTALLSRVDDTGITTINSTGNIWALTDVRSSSTLRIGANNALAIAAPLRIGQTSDAGNSIFELNGFNQEIAGLDYLNGTGANSRRVTNSGAALSTLTINNATNFTFGSVATNGAGNLTGNLALVKTGAGTQTLAGPANTYTGNVTVNGGTLVAGGNITSTALGSPTAVGRTVTVNNAGTILSLTTNNVFGSGVGNANLPATVLNAGTVLTSTRYNVLGNVTLNGATLTQASTDAGGYEGYQFRGTVTVGGSAASTISTTNGKADHLGPNTTFNVADATGSAAADLIVSAPLRNQSNDFGSAASTLTKTGNGTLTLSAAQSYSALVTSAGTTNLDGAFTNGTSTITANATSTININAAQSLGALTIANGAVVNFGPGPGMSPFASDDLKIAAAVVPEPGSIGLLMVGALAFLGRRRR